MFTRFWFACAFVDLTYFDVFYFLISGTPPIDNGGNFRTEPENRDVCGPGAAADRNFVAGTIKITSLWPCGAGNGSSAKASRQILKATGKYGNPPLVVHIIHRFAMGGLENGLVNLINHTAARSISPCDHILDGRHGL